MDIRNIIKSPALVKTKFYLVLPILTGSTCRDKRYEVEDNTPPLTPPKEGDSSPLSGEVGEAEGIIRFFNEDIDFRLFSMRKIRLWLLSVIEQEQKKNGDISCIFCSEKYLLRMNSQYLNASYLTDVITFDYTENERISGDIFISIERVKENAKLYKQPLQQEILRVILHGILHLCGYKDKKEDEIIQMREKEDYYLGQIGF